MIGYCVHRIFRAAAFAALMCSPSLSADWNGDWDSTYGQLRLLQNGDRLYGDYAEIGTIEGRLGKDGRTARAYFVYHDGRWGTVEWRIANDRLSGHWSWSSDGLPQPKGGKSWTATRSSARTSPLKYASQTQSALPKDDAVNQDPFRPWFTFAADKASPSVSVDPRDGLSRWYRGYDLVNIDPAFEIGVDVIHYEGADTAAVDLSIYVRPGGTCAQTLHTGFCKELHDKADSRGFLSTTVTGARLKNRGSVDELIEATFRLPGDSHERLLRIREDVTYHSVFIHHPQRGVDYEGFARLRPHLCEQTRCSNDIFNDLRQRPGTYRIKLDEAYIARMIGLPNRIAASHQTSKPHPDPTRPPQQAGGGRPMMSDPWAILEETGDNLGEISFDQSAGGLMAKGKLRGFFETDEDHQVEFKLAGKTDEALAWELTVYSGQSGERKHGRMLTELPSHARRNPRGTLIVGEDILLFELVRPVRGLDASEAGDTPAIGIYSVSYRLRDVPLNRTMNLRQKPSRSSAVIGSISPRATGLQMLKCADEINAQAFQEAGFERRLSMLSATWCQITNNQVSGWVPGIYLAPETY